MGDKFDFVMASATSKLVVTVFDKKGSMENLVSLKTLKGVWIGTEDMFPCLLSLVAAPGAVLFLAAIAISQVPVAGGVAVETSNKTLPNRNVAVLQLTMSTVLSGAAGATKPESFLLSCLPSVAHTQRSRLLRLCLPCQLLPAGLQLVQASRAAVKRLRNLVQASGRRRR